MKTKISILLIGLLCFGIGVPSGFTNTLSYAEDTNFDSRSKLQFNQNQYSSSLDLNRIGYDSQAMDLRESRINNHPRFNMDVQAPDKITRFGENHDIKKGLTSDDSSGSITLDSVGTNAEIFINGNDDLKQFDGSGTADDPYVITGYEIISFNDILVIKNTDAYILVIENYFHGGKSSDNIGITLDNVTNIHIQDNTVLQAGIGLLAIDVENFSMTENIITEHYVAAMDIGESTDGYIAENEISLSADGFSLVRSTDFEIFSNFFIYNDANGVTFANSDHNVFQENNVKWNGGEGMLFIDSDANLIEGNVVHSNGFYFDECARGCGYDLNVTHYPDQEFPGEFDNAFTAEGRIGDSVDGGTSETFEVDVSKSTSGPFEEGETANFVWSDGEEIPFQLLYESETSTVYFTVGDVTVSHVTNDPLTSLNDVLFRTRALDNATMRVSDVFINDIQFNFSLVSSLDTGDPNVIEINTDGLLWKGINMTGNVMMDWLEGTAPKQSRVAFQISFGNVVRNTKLRTSNILSVEGGQIKLNAFTGAGIYLDPSFENVITNNSVQNNAAFGVYLESSDNTIVSHNYINTNGLNGLFLQDSDYNLIDANFVFDNGYFNDEIQTTGEIDLATQYAINAFTGAGIYLDPSFGNELTENQVYNNIGNGVILEYSNSTTLTGNQITGNGQAGLFVFDSSHNQINSNRIGENGFGTDLQLTGDLETDIALRGLLAFTGAGIYLDPSIDNTVSDNNVFGNAAEGVVLYYSSETQVDGNNIHENQGDGVALINSSSNAITNNEIAANGYAYNVYLNTISDPSLVAFTGAGIYLDPSQNNVVQNNAISQNAVGIYLLDTDETDVSGNHLDSSGVYGLFLENSDGNTISDNIVTNTGTSSDRTSLLAFTGAGIYLDPSFDNEVSRNRVTGNQLGLYLLDSDRTNVSGNVADFNAEMGMFFENSDENIIAGNEVSNNGHYPSSLSLSAFTGAGIYLDPSFDNVVHDNLISNNAGVGLHLFETEGTDIAENVIDANGVYGVFLENSDHNRVANNIVTNSGGNAAQFGLSAFTGAGIYLDPSFDNEIIGNEVSNNQGVGVHLFESDRTNIENNLVDNNGIFGVFLQNSSSNRVAGNDVTNTISNTEGTTLNAFTGAGIYLDPSQENIVEENNVFGNTVGIQLFETDQSDILDNSVVNNSDFGLVLEDSDYNLVLENEISQTGLNVLGLERTRTSNIGLSAFTGAGIYLDPSEGNVFTGNFVTNNVGDGFVSEASGDTLIKRNEFEANGGYGVNLDADTFETSVTENNFFENGQAQEISSQAKDDAVEGGNSFALNFFDDADLTDEDGDGIADNPYPIDGAAENSDETPATEPYIIGVLEVEAVPNPKKITINPSQNNYFLTVTLPEGYYVESIQLDQLFINETVNPIDFNLMRGDGDDEGENRDSSDDESFSMFRLEFNYSDFLEYLPDEVPENIEEIETITLVLSGSINDGSLDIYSAFEMEIQMTGAARNGRTPISTVTVFFGIAFVVMAVRIKRKY